MPAWMHPKHHASFIRGMMLFSDSMMLPYAKYIDDLLTSC